MNLNNNSNNIYVSTVKSTIFVKKESIIMICVRDVYQLIIK